MNEVDDNGMYVIVSVTVGLSLSLSALDRTVIDSLLSINREQYASLELSRRMLDLGAEYGGNLDRYTSCITYGAHATRIPELVEGSWQIHSHLYY